MPAATGGERRAKTALFVRSLRREWQDARVAVYLCHHRSDNRRLERVMGIEPTLVAWEATVLPLNYTRAGGRFYSVHGSSGKDGAMMRRSFMSKGEFE